jgi:hypothetical protein
MSIFPIRAGLRECLPQLLDDPFSDGMWRYVAMQNLASLVTRILWRPLT